MVYVLTTEQDQAPAQFLPSNGSTAYTVDTTDAALLGGGNSLLTQALCNGDIAPGGSGTVSSPVITLTADDTGPVVTFVVNIPLQWTVVTPGDTADVELEILIDDADPLDGPRAINVQFGAAQTFARQMAVAVFTYQITDNLPHTYKVKCSTNATTAAALGISATFTDGRFMIYGDPAHVVAS